MPSPSRRLPWWLANIRQARLYTNDNKAELTIVVTVLICRPAHKYVQMERPLFGMCGNRPAGPANSRGGLG
jgi:hypothetical protein